MPKPNNNKIKSLKKKKPIYTFDMKRIIKEREAERKKNPAFDDLIKNVSVLNQVEIKETNVDESNELSSVLPKLEENEFIDISKYNIPFNDDPDCKKSFLQRLHIMSIELKGVLATIHFNFLMNADWSPVLQDFEDVLQNWSTDIVSLTDNKPMLKHEIKNSSNVGLYNFELVLQFMYCSIMKNPCGFSDNDLLTLAKYSVNMYFDPHCTQRSHVIKKLFSICIETALHKDKNTAIKVFAQELYLNHPLEDLVDMIVELLLPKKGCVMETIYSYLTYTVFKTLLGKNNENTVTLPTSINDWFVQDLVDKNYFKDNPIKIAYNVINLLEHVVVVFDLYANKEKLTDMYNFMYGSIRQNGLSESQLYINKMDQWRLRIYRLRLIHTYAKESSKEPQNQ